MRIFDKIIPMPNPLGSQKMTGIKPVKATPLIYNNSPYLTNRSGIFNPPEYNLEEIFKVADVDSYVKQAFKKKTGLMFKTGHQFVGKNPDTVNYIEARFSQIALVSGLTLNEILRSIGRNLITCQNAFLCKVRRANSSGGKVRQTLSGRTLQPIAAYFPINPSTMLVNTDEFGNVIGWKQEMPDGSYRLFNKSDIIHFYYDKKEGFLFATPLLAPVIDDLRSLRQIEENVEMSIYQFIYPIFTYTIGNDLFPEPSIFEDGTNELDKARDYIENMPLEGGLVIPWHHKVELIGAKGSVIDAIKYLEYFRSRVLSGLGLSTIDIGIADSSNRSTASELSKSLIDDVKDFQRVLEDFFNAFIINELLLESTFDFDTLAPENRVQLRFNEIDTELKVLTENHAADLFMKHGVTFDEYRRELGREPLDLSDEEILGKTYWKMIEEPRLLISASDEPWSPFAQALARTKLGEVQSGDLSTAETKIKQMGKQEKVSKKKPTAKKNPGERASSNKVKNRNQHGSTVGKAKKDNVCENNFVQLCQSMKEKDKAGFSLKEASSILADKVKKEISTKMARIFLSSFLSELSDPIIALRIYNKNKGTFELRIDKYVNRLFKNFIEDKDKEKNLEKYLNRARMIDSFELNKVSNMAKAYALANKYGSKVNVAIKRGESSCEQCLKDFSLGVQNFFRFVPPYHPKCNCQLGEIKKHAQ